MLPEHTDGEQDDRAYEPPTITSLGPVDALTHAPIGSVI